MYSISDDSSMNKLIGCMTVFLQETSSIKLLSSSYIHHSRLRICVSTLLLSVRTSLCLTCKELQCQALMDRPGSGRSTSSKLTVALEGETNVSSVPKKERDVE